ncbi:hypothetical protein [Rhizobium azibense]|uniref:Uncharacterized protein n=1 Tax=Rhizobium azibense TaxID=1136135 RepID=A0A4R3RES6_9HYPH|nr:hypothetical protein [Rhizobium azibense]TCU34038.1 hypothetical protein EV129_11321 [Rhizobium azibense]
MKLQLRNLQRKDEIEVRFATHDGYLWHRAVVMHIDADFIHARYASGHPVKIDRRDDEMYRLPKGKVYG